jgi:homoserine dehydrogenase
VIAVARHLVHGGRSIESSHRHDRRIRPMGDTRGQYYLNLHVEDRPGVLAEIAERFGDNGVSIERVWQEGAGEEATLVFITHRAQEGPFQKTIEELRELDAVRDVASLLRVEGEEG